MKPLHRILSILLLALSVTMAAQDMDKELADLAEKLATPIKERGKKKVTVLDFTDLKGGSSELGKYIAEQLTVNLVIGKRDFSVLDRANLKSILAEHKLTASGLVDPENAKKLGQFAGVDALVIGTIIPKSQSVSLTAKIITTDTAEIVGAARAEFKSDDTVQQLLSHSVAEGNKPGDAPSLAEDKPKVTKTFGDLRVDLTSLRILDERFYVLDFTMVNQNTRKSIWVGYPALPYSSITDPDNFEFEGDFRSISGIVATDFNEGGFTLATELKPNDSVSGSLKFFSRASRTPTPGVCRLQFQIAFEYDLNGYRAVNAKKYNFVTKLEAGK